MIEQSVHEGPFETTFISRLLSLAKDVFPTIDEAEVDWKLRRMPDATVQVAWERDKIVGFKFGYAVSKFRYYSWLGGVSADYRRQGIARQLMIAQHEWARCHGYTSIETGTIKNNESMLRLNLSTGFEIIGTYSRDDGPRVILYKRL